MKRHSGKHCVPGRHSYWSRTRGLSNSDGLRLLIFPQSLGEALKNQNAAPTTPPCFCRRQWSSSLHWADCLRCFAPPPCSNPPACVSLLFVQKKNARVFLHKRSLGGRGWIRTTEAEKQQIYSLSPLATREHAHILFTVHAGLPVYLTTAPWICQVFCRKLFCMNAGSLFPKRKTPEPSTDSGALNGAGDRS